MDPGALNEAHIHVSLRHCNILPMMGYFVEKDHLYMVLEYASGGSLADKVCSPILVFLTFAFFVFVFSFLFSLSVFSLFVFSLFLSFSFSLFLSFSFSLSLSRSVCVCVCVCVYVFVCWVLILCFVAERHVGQTKTWLA